MKPPADASPGATRVNQPGSVGGEWRTQLSPPDALRPARLDTEGACEARPCRWWISTDTPREPVKLDDADKIRLPQHPSPQSRSSDCVDGEPERRGSRSAIGPSRLQIQVSARCRLRFHCNSATVAVNSRNSGAVLLACSSERDRIRASHARFGRRLSHKRLRPARRR